jgi:hypothetical protein
MGALRLNTFYIAHGVSLRLPREKLLTAKFAKKIRRVRRENQDWATAIHRHRHEGAVSIFRRALLTFDSTGLDILLPILQNTEFHSHATF